MMLKRSLAVALMGLVGSCNGGSSGHDAGASDASANGVGPAGGTVSSATGGASVEVPPGALSETVDIRVEEVVSPLALPTDYEERSAVFAFLPHGQGFDLPVTLAIPHSAGETAGLAVLRLDGPEATAWEPVAGAQFTATTATVQTSSFSYYVVGKLITTKLDILFVVDNSSSMAEEQASLVANFNRFVNVLESMEGGLPDLHIGVVSTDVGAGPLSGTGCDPDGDDGELQSAPVGGACEPPTGAFISDVSDGAGGRTRNYTGTLTDVFSCIARLGTDGCGFEQPLESMRRALDGSNAQNAGFLRDEAFLAVVIVTDEDDCSTEDTNMFDPSQTSTSDPLGPLSSFRCFEFGVVCEPDSPRIPGARDGCVSREDSAYMYSVGEYASFLSGLKGDPSKVMVAGIIGNPTPVIIGLDGQDNPRLEPSCVSAAGEATPGVRLAHFLSLFPERSTVTTICNDDLSDALALIAQVLAGG